MGHNLEFMVQTFSTLKMYENHARIHDKPRNILFAGVGRGSRELFSVITRKLVLINRVNLLTKVMDGSSSTVTKHLHKYTAEILVPVYTGIHTSEDTKQKTRPNMYSVYVTKKTIGVREWKIDRVWHIDCDLSFIFREPGLL